MGNFLFDLRATQPLAHGYHGGAMYAIAVFRRFAQMPRSFHVRAFYDSFRPLSADVAQIADSGGIELVAIDSRSELQKLVDDPANVRFYTALPYEYSNLELGRLDVIMTIHGLRPLELPDDKYAFKYDASLKQRLRTSAKRLLRAPVRRRKHEQFARLLAPRGSRRRIVVPSEHTKYSIMVEFPHIDADDIIVSYSPVTDVCARTDTNPRFIDELGLTKRGYILLVSTNRWGKNSYRALTAIEELFERHPDLATKQVVAVGGPPARAPARWRSRFVYPKDIDSRVLATLYENAYLLLYPSLNEGFGYPPLESMSYGTPVIASASTAISEISGDGAVYVTPYAIGEMQSRLLWLLRDDAAWKACAERARQRYAVVSALQERMLDELCQLLLQDHAQ